MKKVLVFIVLLVGVVSGSVQAMVGIPPAALAPLLNSSAELTFEAINHLVVNDRDPNDNPVGPYPGDTFALSGLGIIAGLPDPQVEITYDYTIGGAFTGPGSVQSSLAFTHGIPLPGVSNRMNLYVDILDGNSGTTANADDANSYVDGLMIATFEVLSLPGDQGELTQLGGTDQITFMLVDDITGVFTREYGLTEHRELVLAIESVIHSVDMTDLQNPQPYDFGAFACGKNPFDSCGIEVGVGEVAITHMPVPGALGMAMVGFGVMGWMGKGKGSKK
ncbi:MAG: hypothetical protein V3V31_11425 [Methylococcales bacterium]